jgi:hypothetical protein
VAGADSGARRGDGLGWRMRCWLVAVFVTIITLGCTLPDTSSTGGGGSTAVSTCIQTAGCEDCTQCAIDGPCAELNDACNENSACLGVGECYGNCGGDTSCEADCQADDPDGVSDYTALTNCVDCVQCPTACGGLCTSS